MAQSAATLDELTGGRIGDGVLLNAVSSPEYSANAVAILQEAVRASGRSWDTFEVAQIGPRRAVRRRG